MVVPNKGPLETLETYGDYKELQESREWMLLHGYIVLRNYQLPRTSKERKP